MITTKTDREASVEAAEFLWDTTGATEVHKYVGPVLKKWIPGGSGLSLIDLGCGNGALTAILAGQGLKCTGTDFSESGIKIAQENYPQAEFIQSAMDAPLPDALRGRFDFALAVEVVEHLLLPRQLFQRAKEALKPGGTFIVTTPYHGYLKNLALALCGKFDSHWHPLRDYGHVKFFSVATLRQLFEEEGFVNIEVERVGRLPMFARSMMLKATLPAS